MSGQPADGKTLVLVRCAAANRRSGHRPPSSA